MLSFVFLYTGQTERAVQAAQNRAARGEDAALRALVTRAVADASLRPQALKLLRETAADPRVDRMPPRAARYCLLGDSAAALQELEDWAKRATRRNAIYGSFYLGAPAFDPLRDDPRFVAVFRRLKLPLPPRGPLT